MDAFALGAADIGAARLLAPLALAALLAAGAFLARRRRRARTWLLTAALALAAGVGLAALLGPADAPARRLPELRLERLEGGTVALPELRGQPVVLNLWATWCPPCRRELPLLQAAANAHPDVHFVLADQGETRATVAGYLAGRGDVAPRQVVLDRDGRVGAAFGTVGLPVTLFFDADGRHVLTHVGEVPAAALVNYLADLTR